MVPIQRQSFQQSISVNIATIHWPKSYLGLQIPQQVQMLKLHAQCLVSFSGIQMA